MEELKPCPFCGGKARIRQDKTDGIQYRGMFSVRFHAECEGCGARTKICYAAVPFEDEGENARPEARGIKEVVECWNERTGEKAANKPAWLPMRGQNGELFGAFAFCPRCGMILSQFDIEGKTLIKKKCQNCGTEIEWEDVLEEYPHKLGMSMEKWGKPNDI